MTEFAAQIAVDQRKPDEQRQPKPKRQDDGRRQRARPMQIRDSKTQFDIAQTRRASRHCHHHQSGEAQKDKPAENGAKIDQRKLAVGRETQDGNSKTERR